jgi:glycosyltransferase involved in cell wall biosynthesis
MTLEPRIALVHDWLTGMRGGERVLEALCDLYPNAALFTLVHVPGRVSERIERLKPRPSLLTYLPGIERYYRSCLPLFPAAVEQFDLDGFDVIVSTSHCAAKAVVRSGKAKHLCYCLTPMRYAWDQFDAYFGPDRLGAVPSRLLRAVMARLARWDAATAHRVDRYVAISRYVARRIRRYYNREATVVYPPVDTAFYCPDPTPPEPFALIVSALVPYKRVDLGIDACRQAGVPLRIVGQGPELERLRARAHDDVQFVGYQTDEQIRQWYRRAAMVLLPGEEDFGIVPVEAQACGRPVVALARGGAVETVADGVTGILVAEGTPEAFGEAVARGARTTFDSALIRQRALRFARERFTAEIAASVDEMLGTGLASSPC